MSSRISGEPLSLARHETFHLRDGWLAKGTRAVHRNGAALSQTDAHHELGVGKNMLSAIRYWCQATNLIEPKEKLSHRQSFALTTLGNLLLDADPYLEDVGTIWVIHHQLACNRNLATFWYWAFNEVDVEELNEEAAITGLQHWATRVLGASVITEHSIQKDWSCFARTYAPAHRNELWDDTQCPLSILGLAERAPAGRLRLSFGAKSDLPDLVFAWACARFLQLRNGDTDSTVVSLDELRWDPFSPGRTFCLDMRALVGLIDSLVHRRWAIFSGTAGLRSVHFKLPPQQDLLQEYFAGSA